MALSNTSPAASANIRALGLAEVLDRSQKQILSHTSFLPVIIKQIQSAMLALRIL